jgi:hypothetical protein
LISIHQNKKKIQKNNLKLKNLRIFKNIVELVINFLEGNENNSRTLGGY